MKSISLQVRLSSLVRLESLTYFLARGEIFQQSDNANSLPRKV